MFKKFCEERNLRLSTVKGYETAIKSYTEFHEKTLNELIQEAINEEKTIPDKRERQIKDRILSYRTAKIEEGIYARNTINLYLKKMYTLYRHYDIEIPNIPPITKEGTYETGYFDLPNKKHIKQALNIADLNMQCVILFIASSGTGLSEVVSITVEDFLTATQDYYTSETIPEIIDELYCSQEDIVPTFYVKRQKTNKYYYTYCTPETTKKIIFMLKNKEQINPTDALFDLTWRQISERLRVINDKLNFGFKGNSRFLRSHTLRKFHASNIGLSEEHIDQLQGRSKDTVHATYIKTNPHALKKVYMNAMENVTINTKQDTTIVNEEYHIHINIMLMGTDFNLTL